MQPLQRNKLTERRFDIPASGTPYTLDATFNIPFPPSDKSRERKREITILKRRRISHFPPLPVPRHKICRKNKYILLLSLLSYSVEVTLFLRRRTILNVCFFPLRRVVLLLHSGNRGCLSPPFRLSEHTHLNTEHTKIFFPSSSFSSSLLSLLFSSFT